MENHPREIRIYADDKGRAPFSEWFCELRDMRVKDAVRKRIDRVALGNFGDCKALGGEIMELRFATGLRVYFAEADGLVVILLCGGDKSSQGKDIKRARGYWQEFRAREQQT